MEQVLPGLSNAPNVHPLFVHFPIAFWLGAALLCGLGCLRKHDQLFAAGRWLLYLGTVGAAFAVASGLWATAKMGHDTPGHDLVHVHRNFMLAASALAIVTTLVAFAWRKKDSTGAHWAITALLLALAAVTTLGADRGAELVFRYGVGTAGEAPPSSDHDHDHGEGHDHGAAEGHDDASHGEDTDTTVQRGEPAPAEQAPAGTAQNDAAAAPAASPSAQERTHEHDDNHDHHH